MKTLPNNPTSLHRMIPVLGLILALCALGCPDETNEQCGQGDYVSSGSESACVYKSALLIETGFMCPATHAHQHNYEDVTVCSSDPTLSPGLTDEIGDQGWNVTMMPDDACQDVLCNAEDVCKNGTCVPKETNNTSMCQSKGPVETCGNNKDDDCDGKIDCADDDCAMDATCMTMMMDTCGDTYEPNETQEASRQVGQSMSQLLGHICTPSDEDWFVLDAQGKAVSFSFQSDNNKAFEVEILTTTPSASTPASFETFDVKANRPHMSTVNNSPEKIFVHVTGKEDNIAYTINVTQ